MKLEEVAMEASKLPEKDRASLAILLLDGLETPVCGVSDDEVYLRVREGDADPTVMITFDELISGLQHRGR